MKIYNSFVKKKKRDETDFKTEKSISHGLTKYAEAIKVNCQ